MILITAFVITVLIGDVFAIAIAYAVEFFSKTASLMVFLALFWGLIPFAWRFAVRFTEPKPTTT